MTALSIQVIAHSLQRYKTPGDWLILADDSILVRVSDLGNWKYHALMGVHELVEALICRELGVTQEQVDEFDMKFEEGRKTGLHAPDSEPGAHPDAPYRLAHFVAETVERVLAVALNVDWKEYGERVDAL